MTHNCTHHQPGSVNCYRHGCRCTPCGNAAYAHRKRNQLRALRGRGNQHAGGTQRRLQSLMAVGWSLTHLGTRLGRSRSGMTALLAGVRVVQWATHQAVRDLHNQLWDQTPPEGTPDQKRAATRARRRAQAEGWPPPMAWDDDTGPHGIDNPDATPHDCVRQPERHTISSTDRIEAIENGATLADLIAQGQTPAAIQQALHRAGRPDLWLHIRPHRNGADPWKEAA